MPGGQAKRWSFTSFKPEEPIFNNDVMKYMRFQQEHSPATQRLHWQGWLALHNKMCMQPLKLLLQDNQIHLEICKGSVEQNEKYCTKDETCADPATRKCFGELPTDGTLKQDLWKQLEEDVKAKKNIDDVLHDNFKLACMHGNHVLRMIHHFNKPPAKRKVTNLCIWGATGVGKTHWVYETWNADDVFIKNKSQWWDGYTGQKVIVYDDFYGNIKVGELLNLTDVYRVQVEVKGATVYLHNEFSIFTSNSDPREWYHGIPVEAQKALERRLPDSNIVHATQMGDIPSLGNWNYTSMEPRNRNDDLEPGPPPPV